MDLVGHQAIGPHRDPVALAGLREEIAMERVVVVAEEHLFARNHDLTVSEEVHVPLGAARR
jgi:hypothetical protein